MKWEHDQTGEKTDGKTDERHDPDCPHPFCGGVGLRDQGMVGAMMVFTPLMTNGN